MNIQVQYYAIMREQAGVSQETLNTSARNGSELYAELSQKYPFTLDVSQLRLAINGAFAEMDSPLPANAQVVFIPPVAGG
jgi:molybdenum cofactor guanylyltransferase